MTTLFCNIALAQDSSHESEDINLDKPASSIELKQISENEFAGDGHIGPLHHFGSLFGHDPELRETFNRFNKSRIKQRRGNTVSYTHLTLPTKA